MPDNPLGLNLTPHSLITTKSLFGSSCTDCSATLDCEVASKSVACVAVSVGLSSRTRHKIILPTTAIAPIINVRITALKPFVIALPLVGILQQIQANLPFLAF